MEDLPPEEKILARLRELTEESRRLRHGLEELIRQPYPGKQSRSDDRSDARRKKPRKKR